MAEAFVKVLIERLSSLIQREIGLIMGVDKEMKKLESTLTTIQAVLEDAEDRRFQSKPIQNWLSKLNDIAYEIDDILDECATEVSKLERKCSTFNFKKILIVHDIGTRMKHMNEKLDAIATERARFHFDEKKVPQWSKSNASRETVSILEEPDHIYGRDEDKEKIVDMLVNKVADGQQLSILPIIGLGGLGKTTLAQFVFKDERMSQHFDTKLWVCVSDNFDLKALLKACIESTTKSAPDLEQLDALQSRLREVLNQKRYLLILDDVWNENQESWIKLKSILACGSNGASIVVTTCLKTVADIMGTLPAYELTKLSEEHYWLLFKLRAFGQENEEHPNLETIGRQFVMKCAGVPMAAKALGGLLRFKRGENERIHVKNSELWNFPEGESHILPVLRLRYHNLPLELRQCFVYCAVFQKDSKIEKQDLIFRWMAHGCISSNETQEVEDVGDKIWKELVLRFFFQEADISGIKITFKMHDLVHDLALSIMENKIPRVETKSSIISASDAKIREVYLRNCYFNRSLSSITIVVPTLTTIRNYNHLRILKLTWATIEELPSTIGKLKHLQYLDFTHSYIRSLPHTFCGLWNLQILILDYCNYLSSLPKHIRHMTNLRHIFLKGCSSLNHMPSGIRELTSLNTLSLFIGSHLNELEHLNLGGRLEIKHLERVQNHLNVKKANLVEKPNFRYLKLNWEGNSKSESTKMMDEKVLEALEPHPNLETLNIHGFRGSYFSLWMPKMENVSRICPNCFHLPLLGDLTRLEYLSLRNLAALEYIHVEDEIQGQNSPRAKFPSLKSLKLKYLPNLKILLKEEVGEIFLNLRRLEIKNCPNCSHLPPLGDLPCLSYMRLENLTGLKYIHVEDEIRGQNSVRATFPSLKRLKLYSLPNLKGLLKEEVGEMLPNLQKLHTENCRLLIIPPLSSLEDLTIRKSNLLTLSLFSYKLENLSRLLLDFGEIDTTCTPEDAVGYLCNLKILIIYNAKEHHFFPEKWFRGLKSLKALEIYRSDIRI